MQKFAPLALLALAAATLAGCFGLYRAHRDLREQRPPLPSVEDVRSALAEEASNPVGLWWINSASQDVSRSAVLDSSQDPTPDAPYRMSLSAFVFAWDDGRLLLVDGGMSEDAARDFGWPMELVYGSPPMQTRAPVAERLGTRRNDVSGVVLSHLHADHVEGLAALCQGRSEPLSVFGTRAQFERANYTTEPGLEILHDASCIEIVPLDEQGPLLRVPGFAGVRIIAAAGHTPGSQMVAARVGSREGGQDIVITGDIVNARDGIELDIPKPWLYSTFVVPEDGDRLRELRRFLHSLNQEAGVVLLVPHDEYAIRKTGIAPWPKADAPH